MREPSPAEEFERLWGRLTEPGQGHAYEGVLPEQREDLALAGALQALGEVERGGVDDAIWAEIARRIDRGSRRTECDRCGFAAVDARLPAVPGSDLAGANGRVPHAEQRLAEDLTRIRPA